MPLFGVEGVSFALIIYLYVHITSQTQYNSSRSRTTDSLISPVQLPLPTRRQKHKLLLQLKSIWFRDFEQLYHGIEVDLLLTGVIVGLLSCLCWGVTNWVRYLYFGAGEEASDASQATGMDATDAEESLSTSPGFIFMRLGMWWTCLAVAYLVVLLYYQCVLTWKRLRSAQGFSAVFVGFVAWIGALIVLFHSGTSDSVSPVASSHHTASFSWLTFNLNQAFTSMQIYWNHLLDHSTKLENITFRVPPSGVILFKFALSLLGSVVTFSLVLPVLRMVQCHTSFHQELMKANVKNIRLYTTVSYLNFILPPLVCLLWLQPIRDMFPNVEESIFYRLRLYGVCLVALLEFCSVKVYLQSFLFKTATDCVKGIDTRKSLSDQQLELLRDRMLHPLRLTFVVVCQLTFIPLLLVSLSILGNIRGKYTFGLGPPLPVVASTPETFSFTEQASPTGEELITSVYNYTLTQNFYTETIGFLCWWVLFCQSVVTGVAFAANKLKQRMTNKSIR